MIRIKKITWKEASGKVKKVNSRLAEVIDSLNVSKSFPLYKISYSFGQYILKNGIFYIPDNNHSTCPITCNDVPDSIKKDLGYSTGKLPIGVVLKNSYELFINSKNCLLPVLTTKPGTIVALWKELESAEFHPSKIFNITAGARSLFMLPNISDLTLHKHLKKEFNLKIPPPKRLLDQWEIFKLLANHPSLDCNWETELLFFSKEWFEKIKTDSAWQPLYQLFLEEAWNSSAYERNRMFYDFTVSCAQEWRNLKPNPYLTDTLKHLLMVSIGTGVGFSAAQDDDLAPISHIQNIYLDSYNLKKYSPIIFHPQHFSMDSNKPVYYSLSFPTTLAFSPKSRKISNTLHDLTELKHFLAVYSDEVKKGNLNIEDTIIGKILNSINFEFFHNKPDIQKEIKLTNNIPSGDSIITKNLKVFKREFAESGTFVRGCIRISTKEELK